MTPPAKPARRQWLGVLVVAVLLGALVWLGADSLIEVIDRGVIRNRRGPDLTLAGSPILFWGLVTVFGAGLTLCSGLAVVCTSIAVRQFKGKRDAPGEQE